MTRQSAGRSGRLWRAGPMILGTLAALAAEARADPLRAGADNPWVASVGVGPSFFLHDEGFAQPKLAQRVGVHLLGTSSGPAIGVGIEELDTRQEAGQRGQRSHDADHGGGEIPPESPLAQHVGPGSDVPTLQECSRTAGVFNRPVNISRRRVRTQRRTHGPGKLVASRVPNGLLDR